MENNYIKHRDFCDNFYKCKLISEHIIDYPEDWQKVLPYPTIDEIIDAVEKGKNKTKIIKALKQWKKTKRP